MNLKELNSLIDLFFYKVKKENPDTPFLEWLNPKNKKKYTWGETSTNIYKLNNDNEQRANGGTGRRVGLKIQR